MTRDEAIEKVCGHVLNFARQLKDKENFYLSIRADNNEGIVRLQSNMPINLDYEVGYDPPRRIPPKGTPVMWQPDGMGKHVGICTGESSHCGRPVVKMTHLESSEETWACENWIELVEATP